MDWKVLSFSSKRPLHYFGTIYHFPRWFNQEEIGLDVHVFG